MVWQDERYRRDAVLALRGQAEVPLASWEPSQSRGTVTATRLPPLLTQSLKDITLNTILYIITILSVESAREKPKMCV
jgi:hypothetical protein